MIIVRLLFSRACWLALAPPTLLGAGSRHCHGINYTHYRVNEFYKKGCQEKTPPRPEWRVFLEIQPTVVSLLWRGLACCPFSCVSLLMVTMRSSGRERQA